MNTETLNAEIHHCRETQSWAPESVRTGWVDELVAIRDAVTDTERSEAITYANAEAIRLATIVARRLAPDHYRLRDSLANVLTHDDYRQVSDMNVTEIVAWMRQFDEFTIDDGEDGKRDGFIISRDRAVAYASVRSWQGPDGPSQWVEVDLLTGDAEVMG